MKKVNKRKISKGLLKASWRVVKTQRMIIGAQALGVVTLATLYILIIAVINASLMFGDGRIDGGFENNWTVISTGILIYFMAYLINNFCVGAMTWIAMERFDGRDASLSEGFAKSRQRFKGILLFSLLQAAFMKLLEVFSRDDSIISKLIYAVTHISWSIATVFALPIIMIEGIDNPFKAIKKSAGVVKKVWKESVYAGLSLVGISVLVTFVITFIFITGGMLAIDMPILGIPMVVFGFFALIIFALIVNALNVVVVSAAYYYAKNGKVPAGFDEELIRSVFKPKKKWLSA